MTSILKWLKLLADPTRVRILRILRKEKLSVAEIQNVLGMGQSRISSHLSQLKSSGLLKDERFGKNIFYEIIDPNEVEREALNRIFAVIDSASKEIPECFEDSEALKLALEKRSDKARAYFDELAGNFGQKYVPGRSWKSLAEMLLQIMDPGIVADLGSGEGTLTQLLAQRATKVIAIDSSNKMISYASKISQENGYDNIEYRLGDIESPPIDDNTVNLTILSQALHHTTKPQIAIDEAFRITAPGGRVVILDLLRHDFEQAHELYADVWLGFTEIELIEYLKNAGFISIQTAIVDKEQQAPHFETLMAIALKNK
ncbi:MAG: metalloregulator ArsR/SmtB family transcription factor [Verrucomicrobiales bacterium]|jgi:ArsR family transcriptional regulator|nr:metalloregulator ArsR/SmtB family transcription factor [Verrucomicrobiales bacterium]